MNLKGHLLCLNKDKQQYSSSITKHYISSSLIYMSARVTARTVNSDRFVKGQCDWVPVSFWVKSAVRHFLSKCTALELANIVEKLNKKRSNIVLWLSNSAVLGFDCVTMNKKKKKRTFTKTRPKDILLIFWCGTFQYTHICSLTVADQNTKEDTVWSKVVSHNDMTDLLSHAFSLARKYRPIIYLI